MIKLLMQIMCGPLMIGKVGPGHFFTAIYFFAVTVWLAPKGPFIIQGKGWFISWIKIWLRVSDKKI